jgi:hypothetical protein
MLRLSAALEEQAARAPAAAAWVQAEGFIFTAAPLM